MSGQRDLLTLIRERRSVRRYQSRPVPSEAITALLEAARWAPSAGNLQPWFFYVVTKQKEKELLAKAALNQHFISQAPVCLVVCAEPERSARVYGDRGRYLYCFQDTAAAAQNILLAAFALGLGACWVGAFREEEVRLGLSLPKGLLPVALIPVGYPAGEPERRSGRRELSEVTGYV
ncbi:MAG: nitroreductase family protein [Desulfotomaculales bacterium]